MPFACSDSGDNVGGDDVLVHVMDDGDNNVATDSCDSGDVGDNVAVGDEVPLLVFLQVSRGREPFVLILIIK